MIVSTCKDSCSACGFAGDVLLLSIARHVSNVHLCSLCADTLREHLEAFGVYRHVTHGSKGSQ